MPTLAPALRTDEVNISGPTLAREHFEKNLAALRETGSPLGELLESCELQLEWLFGRDGTLTARTAEGQWWARCSVPLLAGRALLATLEADPLSSCLLSPGHVGLVLAARERMGDGPALLVIEPNLDGARVILGCADFSAEIVGHRLWFVSGPEWATQLRRVFDDYPGLATPSRFIRTKFTPADDTDRLIVDAQAVFSAVLEDRATAIGNLKARELVTHAKGKILLVGGSKYRLWEDGTTVLERELSGQDVHRFDMDDPLSTSPIPLIEAARACGSIVSADVCRADSTNAVPMELPWVTWMTQPAAPPFSTAGPKDALILADAAWRPVARSAGWPDARVQVCGWPIIHTTARANVGHKTAGQVGDQPFLGILCDTMPIRIPKAVEEFSSHRVLWEMIEEELHGSPLAVDDPEEYLRTRANDLQVDLETLDRSRFARDLILPAYQQGLARLLVASAVPIRACGCGWENLPEFSCVSEGPLHDRAAFERSVMACKGLVYCWPTRSAHPIDATGKPVVHRVGQDTASLVRNARRILAITGTCTAAHPSARSLGAAVRELLEIA